MAQSTASQTAHVYPYQLPPLPYAYDALEPYIDKMTMEIHYTKHHGGYVNNLNKALESQPDLQKLSVAELLSKLNQVPENIRTAVRNNGGGHLNHSMFWKLMKKGGGGEPKGEFAEAIQKAFGSFADFRQKFTAAALGRFGSGWAWLLVRNGSLAVESTPNQDNPVIEGARPVFGLDVWEHAYYLKYQNRRNEYIESWWHLVNWEQAAENYQEARK
ncbi:MAG TPA: superoxide dismutase [Patescibacteria group bacterium]|nr:superoxide dismutase [Patescibacteria group bacterium]